MTAQTKPITIITTIQPPDAKGKRKVSVAAAPENEMPVIFTGTFAEWRDLETQAYVEVIKRKPQTVKAAATAAKKRTGGKADKVEEPEETGPIGPAEETTEAEAPVESVASEPEAEELPIIEGDDVTEGEAQLSLIEDNDNG